MRGDPLDGLAVFRAVAATSSFSSAAAQLQRAPASVSEAIKTLEARLGVQLFVRTTRSVALTEAGERLFARLGPALLEIEAAIEDARDLSDRPSGLLRINAPRIAGALVLEPLIARFCAANPDVTVELSYEEVFVDIVSAGYDAGVRLGEALQQDMISVPLTRDLHIAVVGSPDLVQRVGKPKTPHDLIGKPCIRFRQGSGRTYDWEFEKDGEAFEIATTGPLIVNDSDLAVQAALAGVGFAYVVREHVAGPLKDKRLVRVLDDWAPSMPGFFLYYANRAWMPLKLRAFIDLARRR